MYVDTADPVEVLAEYAGTTRPADNVDTRGSDSFQRVDESRRKPYGHCTTDRGQLERGHQRPGLPLAVRLESCGRIGRRPVVPAARAAGVPRVVWADVTLAVGASPHRVLHGHRESR
jgi:hypothetical protein